MNCGKDKIFNPDTKRCVKINGKIGQEVIKKYGTNPKIECPEEFYFEIEYGCKKGKEIRKIIEKQLPVPVQKPAQIRSNKQLPVPVQKEELKQFKKPVTIKEIKERRKKEDEQLKDIREKYKKLEELKEKKKKEDYQLKMKKVYEKYNIN